MTTIKLKNGSGAPLAGDLVQGEPALDLTNKRLYTEDSGGTVIEVGTNPGTDVTFADNRKAVFGAGSDLQIYHDANDSYISDQGSGNLKLLTDEFRLRNAADSAHMLTGSQGGAITAYHNGTARLATTSTGIDVTGVVKAAGTVLSTSAALVNSTSAGGFGFASNNTAFYSFGADASTAGSYTFQNLSNDASINITAMKIDASGNVGIGVSSLVTGSTRRVLQVSTGSDGGQIAFADSTTEAANPRIFATNKSDLKLSSANSGSSTIQFITGTTPAERMRIDSSGNLLVGKISADFSTQGIALRPSDGASFTRTSGSVIDLNRKTTDGELLGFYKDGTTVGSIGTATSGYSLYFQAGDVGLKMEPLADDIKPCTTNGASRDAAIDLGDSAARFKDLYLSGRVIADGVTTSAHAWSSESNSSSSSAHLYFRNPNGFVGNISTSGTSTAYNTSSDYRLKENVVPLTGATERVKQLNPSRFNFIVDADTTVDGFLAHEVADVVPEAITGTKDGMRDEEYEVTPAVYEDVVIPAVLDEEGNEVEAERTEQQLVSEAVMGTRSVPDYQGIDQSKLVPLLVATIQELEARITALESN